MNPPRCPRTVEWWGLDMIARCRKRTQHAGNHFDGVWFFDGNGLRVDGTVHTAPVHWTRELVST